MDTLLQAHIDTFLQTTTYLNRTLGRVGRLYPYYSINGYIKHKPVLNDESMQLGILRTSTVTT